MAKIHTDEEGRSYIICATCKKRIYTACCTICDKEEGHCIDCMEDCKKRQDFLDAINHRHEKDLQKARTSPSQI